MRRAADAIRALGMILRSSAPYDGARLFGRLAAAAAGSTFLTLGMLAFDDRTLDAENVWLKPLKFSVSFAVLFATLGFVAHKLSDPWRASWTVVAAAIASAAALVFEMVYIVAQAARREASHFNESTPFHALMYGLMGVGASTLMAAIALVGIVAWLDRGARLGKGVRLGVGLGFLLTAVMTSWVAGELAGNGGRYVGLPSDTHARIPFLGWSREVGDLRPAHFFALHAMQVLPAAGYALDKCRASTRALWICAALYTLLTASIFAQALQGIPLIRA
ncbi:MAG: hypothetical protein ACK5XB_22015 [Rhodospirillales bacterium]|jgi:hypothetical protein